MEKTVNDKLSDDPVELEDRPEEEGISAPQSRRITLSERFAPRRLASRIILLNLLGLMVLVGGILYFNQFRQGLIDARVESLTTQAQIIAAAIASSATVDTGSIVINPESLSDPTDPVSPDAEQMGDLDFPIDPERTGPVLRRLLANTNVRARVIDADGNLIVDSLNLYSGGEIVQSDLPQAEVKGSFLSELIDKFYNWVFSYNYPVQKEYSLDNGLDFPEVKAALNGAAVSVVRLDEHNDIIVLVSVPVQRFRAVLGALVLSTSGDEINDVLQSEHRVVLYTFGFVALVTILLSLLLAGTIAEPIRRLSAAAERVRRGVNQRVEIPDFTSRRDEIGHLSGALRDMTSALYNRMDAIEGFAADVSHELKNPLTSLRSAVETLTMVKTDEQRQRLVTIVKDDVRRLDRLITDISDASRLDAELSRAEIAQCDVAETLGVIVTMANETRKENQAEIILHITALPKAMDPTTAFMIQGHESRLGQVFRNLIDNARSFTKADTAIIVRVRRVANEIEVRVEDQGPGIRPDNLERIFERFYTDRPETFFGQNSGLGLAISRQIVEAHKGRIWAENRYGKSKSGGERPTLGARFTVRLPAAETV